MKVIKRNILFLFVFLTIIVCFVKKNNYLPMPIVSHPDSQIAFSTEQDVLEQTWQPQVKKVCAITLPYEAVGDFSSDMRLKIFTDDYSTVLAETVVNHDFVLGEAGELSFKFKTVDLVPGERYRIQLSFENFVMKGGILVNAGSNYSGCTIDGAPCNQAAAFNITYIKNSRLFWLFAVIFPILSVSLALMTVWNRKWEETVGVSLIAIVFVMYVAGLTEHLLQGIYLVYFLSAICLGIAIFIYNRKQMTIRDLFSPGLAVYGLLFLLILINCKGAWLARWDEYSHWGLAVKDMFYYDSFAKHFGTTVLLPRYLPFSTLVEYFFVFANGLFSQDLLYVAYQTTLLSALILICRAAHNRWKYLLPAVSIIVFVPVIFFIDSYNCIYVDPLMAALMAYVLICYFSEEMSVFNMLRIAGGLFALTMTKDAGVAIAGMLALIMLADSLYRQFYKDKKQFKEMIFPGCCLLLVLLFYLSWQVYLSVPVNVPMQETQSSADTSADTGVDTGGNVEEVVFTGTVSASGITLGGIFELIQGNAPEYKYQSIKNCLVAVFDDETFRFGSIGISYGDLFIIILIVIGILHYLGVWGERSKKMLSFGVLVFMGALGYGAFMEIMYIYAFPEHEALILNSYGRYFGAYACGSIIAFLYLILCHAAERIISLLMTAVLLISVPMEGFVVKNMDYQITENEIYGTDDMAEVLRSFSQKGEKIYYIYNNGPGYSYLIFHNTVSPLLASLERYNILSSKESIAKQMALYEENLIEVKGTPIVVDLASWEKELKEYNYVFIQHPDEMFVEDYGILFEAPETVDNGTFYEVIQADTGVTLHYIGKVGMKDWR